MASLFSRIAFRYRQLTWRSRALPSFLIVGAQKAGTSSLCHYMRQHPQLLRSWRKELHFFDGGADFLANSSSVPVDRFSGGERYYRSFFPYMSRVKEGQQCFEATPSYMFHPLAPERIARLLPQARVIMLLRNPSKRAISHYHHNVRAGRERLSLRDAMFSEEDRLRGALQRNDYLSLEFRAFSYKLRGMYLEQIRRFQNVLPPDRILILDSSKFSNEPLATLRRTFEFVGVDPDYRVRHLGARNVGQKQPKADLDVMEHLDAHFRPHNESLRAHLGIDFGW